MRNKQVSVNFFDMSGDMVYYEVRNEFYNGLNGVIVVFDVSKQKSFFTLGRWLQELKTESGSFVDNIEVCICGNKTDQFPREVSYFEASQWCARRNLPYFETSALTGHGVDEAIQTLLETIVEPTAEATWSTRSDSKKWWTISDKDDVEIRTNSTFYSSMRIPRVNQETTANRSKSGGGNVQHKSTAKGYTQEEVNVVNRIRNAKTHFDKLGVGPFATRDEINRAYRKLAFATHPDKNRAPGSEDAFKELNAARKALLQTGS